MHSQRKNVNSKKQELPNTNRLCQKWIQTFLPHICFPSPFLPLARRKEIDSYHKYGLGLNSPFCHWFRTNSPPTDSVCKHNKKNTKLMSDLNYIHNISKATHRSMLVWIALMKTISQQRAGRCSRDSPWSWDQGFNGDKPVECWRYIPGVEWSYVTRWSLVNCVIWRNHGIALEGGTFGSTGSG